MLVLLQVLEEGETKAVTTVGKKRIRLVEDILNKKPRNYTWGSLDIDEFIQKITQEGITDAKVEQVASGYIIHLVIKSWHFDDLYINYNDCCKDVRKCKI